MNEYIGTVQKWVVTAQTGLLSWVGATLGAHSSWRNSESWVLAKTLRKLKAEILSSCWFSPVCDIRMEICLGNQWHLLPYLFILCSPLLMRWQSKHLVDCRPNRTFTPNLLFVFNILHQVHSSCCGCHMAVFQG